LTAAEVQRARAGFDRHAVVRGRVLRRRHEAQCAARHAHDRPAAIRRANELHDAALAEDEAGAVGEAQLAAGCRSGRRIAAFGERRAVGDDAHGRVRVVALGEQAGPMDEFERARRGAVRRDG